MIVYRSCSVISGGRRTVPRVKYIKFACAQKSFKKCLYSFKSQVVLADGRISTCTENQTKHVYPDGTELTEDNGNLFWALRGGGGGTFGVVVYYVFRLHQAPKSLVRINMLMPFYHKSEDRNVASEFLSRYGRWTTAAPSYWGGGVVFDNYDIVGETAGLSGNLTGIINILLIKLGPWDENTMSEIQDFVDLKEQFPTSFTSFVLTNYSSFWDIAEGFEDVWDPVVDRSYFMGSLIPAESHNTNFSNFLWKEYRNDDNVPISCIFIRLGGKNFHSKQMTSKCSLAAELV